MITEQHKRRVATLYRSLKTDWEVVDAYLQGEGSRDRDEDVANKFDLTRRQVKYRRGLLGIVKIRGRPKRKD